MRQIRKMKISKEKCKAWIELIMALIKMTRELNDEEAKYIKARCSILIGELELQKLKEEGEL